ncbi:MAG: hypothetical protein AB7O38_29610 [Pirellulaceae bacterium]
MTIRAKVAFLCLTIPTLSELGLGLVYFTASEMMPYHEQALGTDWPQLEPGVRTMLLTFVRGYGSAHLAVGIALATLVLIPLRRGQTWARWTILATGLPVFGATAYLSSRLALTTGANVPWQGATALLAIFVIGVVLVDPAAIAESVKVRERMESLI